MIRRIVLAHDRGTGAGGALIADDHVDLVAAERQRLAGGQPERIRFRFGGATKVVDVLEHVSLDRVQVLQYCGQLRVTAFDLVRLGAHRQ